MELKSIKITNYRSIKNVELNVSEVVGGKKCMILLGINESGKSNILKAINSKENENRIAYYRDCNQEAEGLGKDIEVLYDIDLTSISAPHLKISGRMPEELAKGIKFKKIQKKVLIKNDTRTNVFNIQIIDNKDFLKYVLFNDKIQFKTDKNIEHNGERITNSLNKEKLEKYLENEKCINYFSYYMPKVIFWKAEDKYLINKEIDLNSFKEDTSISIPLRNCFHIAGIKQNDIKSSINVIVDNSAKKTKLQRKLSEKITQHINTVWTEHKIKISFDIDNMKLSFLIEEQDDSDVTIEVGQRSDGFKQFISILLNLSIENETGVLKNKIILLDEPEIHLHPSGQKYLRDELLKIAENNIVIYATHSPYMVDKKNLDRHYHIEKDNGLTTIKKIERDNPFGDEVLYNALGTSILEHIKSNILIVEGKTDRDIFNLYCQIFNELSIPNISVISTDGAKNFPKYAKFLNTNLIKGFTLSDSDKDGKKAKQDVLAMGDKYTEDNTFEINDFLTTKKQDTIEDLFDKEHLENAVKEIIEINLVEVNPFIAQIKNKKKDIDEKIIKKNFMKEIYQLSKEQLKEQKYYYFFEKLIEKINA
ncbi:hypothetical protein [uncultured Gammaproteobacteria bacterium]|nr:hypothetical protein [uncultured Gammaproteobacteria bacterium]CAC9967392.1 hypothetical protein [uncultured Gammaproteobacteria bacterium]